MRDAAPVVGRLLRPLCAVVLVGLAGPAWAACPAGQVACGTGYCIPARQTCCESVGYPNKYCPSGRACNADGTTCAGSALGCAASYVSGMSSCGSDACACTTTCTGNSSCPTNCCAPAANSTSGSYCAPSCVCQGLGSFVLYCSASGVDGGVVDPGRDAGVDAAVWPDGGGGGGDGGPTRSGPTRDPFGPGCHLGGGGAVLPTCVGLLMALVVMGRRRRCVRR
jgi:hypothetical protein